MMLGDDTNWVIVVSALMNHTDLNEVTINRAQLEAEARYHISMYEDLDGSIVIMRNKNEDDD